LLALDAHSVDVIVLDLMMPGMNGNAFLRIVRNDQRRKAIPVIILSALATGELLKGTIELGVHAWFTKAEYTAHDLLEAIDRLSRTKPRSIRPTLSDPPRVRLRPYFLGPAAHSTSHTPAAIRIIHAMADGSLCFLPPAPAVEYDPLNRPDVGAAGDGWSRVRW